MFYFLNEQFIKDSFKDEEIVDTFENLHSIFEYLKTLDVVYKYKLKYEYTLYSEEYVKHKKYREYIYMFKLDLLNYIAKTD